MKNQDKYLSPSIGGELLVLSLHVHSMFMKFTTQFPNTELCERLPLPWLQRLEQTWEPQCCCSCFPTSLYSYLLPAVDGLCDLQVSGFACSYSCSLLYHHSLERIMGPKKQLLMECILSLKPCMSSQFATYMRGIQLHPGCLPSAIWAREDSTKT